MPTSEEQWVNDWKLSAKKRRTRSVLMTLVVLLPALLFAASLTKVSTDAVTERDQQITVLQDSIQHIEHTAGTTVPIFPDSVPGIDSALIALNEQLQQDNQQLRDSLAKQAEILNENEDRTLNEVEALKIRLEEIERKLRETTAELRKAQATNKELCGSLSAIAASITKLQPFARQNKDALAIIRQLSSDLKKADALCR